jgi:hypothetical protein
MSSVGGGGGKGNWVAAVPTTLQMEFTCEALKMYFKQCVRWALGVGADNITVSIVNVKMLQRLECVLSANWCISLGIFLHILVKKHTVFPKLVLLPSSGQTVQSVGWVHYIKVIWIPRLVFEVYSRTSFFWTPHSCDYLKINLSWHSSNSSAIITLHKIFKLASVKDF